MKLTPIYPFLLCGLLMLSFSCTSGFYIPSDGHTLQINEKNDLKASASLSSIDGSRMYSGQLGYSPIKNVAIVANAFKLQEDQSALNQRPQSNASSLLEGAIGTYFFKNFNTPIEGEPLLKDGILFDFYTGLGIGSNRVFYNTGGDVDLDYRKFYMQAGIAFQEQSSGKSFFSIGYNVKLSHLDYRKGLVLGDIGTVGIQAVSLIENNEPFNLVEYTLSLQGGFTKIQVFANYTRMQQLGKDQFPYTRSTFRSGIIFNIDEMLFKKKNIPN